MSSGNIEYLGFTVLVKGINKNLVAPEIKAILIDSADTKLTFSQEAIDAGVTSPNKVLNVKRAVDVSKLTVGINMKKSDPIVLIENQLLTAKVAVQVPSTTVSALDVVLLVDQSGSYDDDIATLKSQASDIFNDLKNRDLDVQFGLAGFSDFPLNGWGDASSDDEAYYLHHNISGDIASITNTINGLTTYFGEDTPESQLEALYQITTGTGRDINFDGDFSDTGELNPASIGWRKGALRILLLATDARFHDSDEESNYPGEGKTATIQALKSTGTIVFGLQSGSSTSAGDDITEITNATGGVKYDLDYSSSEIADAIALAVDSALEKVDVSLEVISGDNWIDSIAPSVHADVNAGSTVEFDVILKGQRRQSINDLSYDVYLWGKGDGSAILGRYHLPILVPEGPIK